MAKTAAAATGRQTKAPPVEYASAMDKLRDEMAKNAGERYVQVVGEFLTGYLLEHPEAEEKLLDSAKSIRGSLEAMRKEAQKVNQGNVAVAVLDDQTAFGIVLEYFGLKTGENALKTGENVTAEAGTSSVTADAVPPDARRLARAYGPPEGKAFGEAGKADDADPFDLDALLASGNAGLSPSDPQDSPGETRDAKRGGALAGVM